MATAKEEREKAARGEGCLGKAADDEPVFILRAQDLFASRLVERWADVAEDAGCALGKIAEARDLAWRMRKWHKRKVPD